MLYCIMCIGIASYSRKKHLKRLNQKDNNLKKLLGNKSSDKNLLDYGIYVWYNFNSYVFLKVF